MRCAWFFIFMGWVPVVLGQESEEPIVSGPLEGTPLGNVNCYAGTGARAGQEFDAATVIGEGGPGALLFIHDLSRNTAPVIRKFDQLGSEYSILGFEYFTIMLSGDRTEGENMLKRVNGSLQLSRPIVLSLDGLDGPGDYALNRRCTLTLVLAKGGKVHRSIGLTDTGPADFDKLTAWIEEVAGKLPEDGAALKDLIATHLPEDAEKLRRLATDQAMEIRRLRKQLEVQNQGSPNRRARMATAPAREAGQERLEANRGDSESRRENAEREGRPPDDSELAGLLRSFIRKTNDQAQCDEVFKQIESRAEGSESLTQQAVEMFKLMLSYRDRYGTKYAQGLAESFLKTHDVPRREK